MRYGSKERELLFKLLQENASLEQVRDFLKDRSLASSAGSWDVMIDVRLKPAMEKGDLKPEDVLELVRITEEHGAQHIFLYRCSTKVAADLRNPDHVRKGLRALDLETLLEKAKLVDHPRDPAIVDVRWDGEEGHQSLVIKIVEQRVTRVFVKEETDGPFVLKRYKEEKVRGVNLFKLHPDGLLELRIQSHRNTSEYQADIDRLWAMVAPLLQRKAFSELPIATAKQNLWEKRADLEGVVRYSGAAFRNNKATTLSAATGAAAASLSKDKTAGTSLDLFLKDDAYCDSSNVWWDSNNGVPSKDTHVLLSGLPHEFAVTMKCSKEDYEYVLGKLRQHNQ